MAKPNLRKLNPMDFTKMNPTRQAVIEATPADPLPGLDSYVPNQIAKALHPSIQHVKVVKIEEEGLKVPHMGWNELTVVNPSPVAASLKSGDHVYFVHSYHGVDCDEALSASTEYGARITAAVECGNIYGTQFHPEKSGEVGLSILRAFCEI